MSESLNLTNVEPKLCNRFTVTFPPYFNLPNYVVNQVTRPSCILSKDSEGKTKFFWQPMSFRLYDPISPSTSHALMAGLEFLNKEEKRTIIIRLVMQNAAGEPVEIWDITGEICDVNFGLLQYETTEPCFISMNMLVHDAKLIK